MEGEERQHYLTGTSQRLKEHSVPSTNLMAVLQLTVSPYSNSVRWMLLEERGTQVSLITYTRSYMLEVAKEPRQTTLEPSSTPRQPRPSWPPAHCQCP